MNKYYTTEKYSSWVDENNNYRVDTDSDKVFAKAVLSGPGSNTSNNFYINQKGTIVPSYYKYYVRTYPNRKLYDPVPLYSISDNKNSFIDKVCRSENVYRETTEAVFNMYLSYLQTESPQYYTKAQRELNDQR